MTTQLIDAKNIGLLKSAIDTSILAGIENIVIESGEAIRGINENGNSLIISTENVPYFGDGVLLGIARLKALKSHLGLINSPELEISYELSTRKDKENEISILNLKGPKTKSKFRCTSASIIKAPKGVADNEFAVVSVDKANVADILASSRVIGAKEFALVCSEADGKYKVSFVFSNEQDNVSIEVSDEEVGFIDDDDSKQFSFFYQSDNVLSLIRQVANDSSEESIIPLIIGEQGTMQVIVNNHKIILFPRMDIEEDF